VRSPFVIVCAVTMLFAVFAAPTAHAVDSREQARNHYETGLGLFNGGDREQALVEFTLANELFPSNDVVFMLAQCEYHLGRLKDARAHYQRFLASDNVGPLAETARLRVAAIDRRPALLVINTVPSDVSVTIQGEGKVFTGQAPNNFPVPKGSYKIEVSRSNYETQVRNVVLDIGETHPMFFKLDAVPGRLIIKTSPRNATLFVRGMRAENPYNQQLEPGSYEIYSEAENHESRRETVEVSAGQQTSVNFDLAYVQRSGRGDLIAAWGILGATAAVALVMDRVATDVSGAGNPASLSLLTAAAGVGAVSGGLLGARLTPNYIADNRSMYRIGAMTIGAIEGTLAGLSLKTGIGPGLAGGATGLGLGTCLGIWTDKLSPSFGRVTMVQSAAVAGALAGFLAVPAFEMSSHRAEPVSLLGLNIGLGVSIAGVYWADQSDKGPSWQRVVLIDLSIAAGVFAGAVVGTIPNCKAANTCKFDDTPTTTKLALAGGGLGFIAGWLLTDGMDLRAAQMRQTASTWMPNVTAIPTQAADGSWRVMPGLSAQGNF
jgi:hypothetical protein